MAHKAEKTQPVSLLSAPLRRKRLKKPGKAFSQWHDYAQKNTFGFQRQAGAEQ